MQVTRRSPLWMVAGVALSCSLVAWLSLDHDRGRGAASPSTAARAATAERATLLADRGTASELWQPRTQEGVRELVRFCRAATSEHVPELRSVALSSGDPLVAGNALRALGRLHAVARDPELIALVDDERPRVRQELVFALGESGYEPAVGDLLPLLDDDDLTLHPLVLHALGRLGGARARARLRGVVADPDSTATDRAFARAALKEVAG